MLFGSKGITVSRSAKQGWEEEARKDMAGLFEDILDTRGGLRQTADPDAARALLEKYSQQKPLEENRDIVVKDPLQEFLKSPFGNYPGGMSKELPIQGVFYERALQKSAGKRRDNLDAIALDFINATDKSFFSNGRLNEKITGSNPTWIPYLHFALEYNMPKVAKALIKKVPFLAQQLVDGRSAYFYAFKGGITDSKILKEAGAIPQEEDFNLLSGTDKNKFLAFLKKNKINTDNVKGKITSVMSRAAEKINAKKDDEDEGRSSQPLSEKDEDKPLFKLADSLNLLSQ